MSTKTSKKASGQIGLGTLKSARDYQKYTGWSFFSDEWASEFVKEYERLNRLLEGSE
jgi:hypothetical protein